MPSVFISGTGHRPQGLGIGYDANSNRRLTEFAMGRLSNVVNHDEFEIAYVISGMALGWDQALAHAALLLNLPLICAIPFQGQESQWPEHSQLRYKKILDKAQKIVVVSEGGYSAKKMMVRNEWMMDRSTSVLALWNGSRSGGTYQCLSYAKRKGVHVTNLWENWKQYIATV